MITNDVRDSFERIGIKLEKRLIKFKREAEI